MTNTVIEIFDKFRQIENLHESGGIVLGQVNEVENKVLVCRASIPSKLEENTRFSFERNNIRAQEIVEYEFYNSSGRNTYLGEWHTHPSKTAMPSHQDTKMIFDQYRNNTLLIKFTLLFVVAIGELFVGLYDGKKIISTVIKY